MKSQIRFILFALLLPACGDRETAVARAPIPSLPIAPSVVMPAPAVTPAPTPGGEADKLVQAPATPTTFDGTLQAGRALAAKGDRAGARDMFEAAAKLDKRRSEPQIELARMYIAGNERGLAAAAANKAVKLAPLSSQAWNTKGRADLNRFAYDDAVAAFSKAAELDENNVWAWNNLGYTELLLKNYEDAAEHFTEATSRAGATGYMWNNLGTAFEHLDRLDEARHAFEQGAQLGSGEAVASRKRLEGVTSIAIATKHDDAKPKADKTFELNEGPTEGPTDKPGEQQPAADDGAM